MGLTTALYSGLSGLNANSEAISVAGNNIANANTNGFKSSRISFETQISSLRKAGTSPSAELGGSNPSQVGLGVKLAAISRNFNGGPLNPTGVKTDLAIEGDGFFVVSTADGPRYTRDGGFKLDKNFNLVNANGGLVQGFAVDDDFKIIDGILTDISIPLGRISENTENAYFDGNLNSGGNAAVDGTNITSETLYSDATATTPATATTNLLDLYDSAGNKLFGTVPGDLIRIDGAELGLQGGKEINSRTFEIGSDITDPGQADDAGETLGSLAQFLQDTFSIDTSDVDGVPLAGGVSISAGQLVIEGNIGEANHIKFSGTNLKLNGSDGPLSFDTNQSADGESLRTNFYGYDSLGNILQMDMTIVMESKTDSGTQWRYYAYSGDNTDADRNLGTGTLTFDNEGQLLSTESTDITVARAGTGAVPSQIISLNFESEKASLTAFSDTKSQVSMIDQDGSAFGSLDDYEIDSNGLIQGVFTNGLRRDLGQIPLARFANNEGLVDEGSNLYATSVNTGEPQIVDANSNGAGRVVGSAIEGSNTELSQEFINLITASTGFSASSRVLSTSDQLIQELLATIR